MKTICLLLGIGFISLQGFAGEDEKPDENSAIEQVLQDRIQRRAEARTQYNQEKAQWLSRLNDESSWRQRVSAVKDWKTVLHPYSDASSPNTFADDEEIFSQLEFRLSDKSQKVREAAVTAFKEMGMEWSYSGFRPHIVEALAKERHNDTESLFLRKIKPATEIFRKTDLLTTLENEGGSIGVLLELQDSGLDKVFESLYRMIEVGMSNKQNVQIRWASIQFLSVALENIAVSLRLRLFNTHNVEGQFSDRFLHGVQIAVTGLADKKSEIRISAKELLSKTFQAKSLSDAQVSLVIPSVAEKGFSHSDYTIRKSTIAWLLEIEELYPSLNSEITSLLKERQSKESSQRMKVALKRALRQLARSVSAACREQWQES